MTPTLPAIVAASGLSTRMGTSKALMDAGGHSFLARIIGSLRDGGADPILVVVREVEGPEAEEARAQILVLNARSSLGQSWNRLNRLLHRPQFERIALQKASFDEPFVIPRSEFEKLVSSPADYARFSQFFVNRGLGQAPELSQVDAQLAAKRRDWTSQRRSYWLPDFNLSGRYTSNFSQSGAGAGPVAGEDLVR